MNDKRENISGFINISLLIYARYDEFENNDKSFKIYDKIGRPNSFLLLILLMMCLFCFAAILTSIFEVYTKVSMGYPYKRSFLFHRRVFIILCDRLYITTIIENSHQL